MLEHCLIMTYVHTLDQLVISTEVTHVLALDYGVDLPTHGIW